MKIVIIDTETTHVVPGEAQVLELGVTLYDTNAHNTVESLFNMPKLTMLIYREDIKGSFSTINFNRALIEYINNEICAATNRNDLLFFKLKDSIRVDNKYGQDHHMVICSINNVVREFWRFVDSYGFSERTSKHVNTSINFDNWNPEDGKYMFKSMNMAGKNIVTFDIPVLSYDIPFWKDNIKMRHRQIDPAIAFAVSNDEAMPDLKQCFGRIGAQDHIVQHRAVDDCIDVAILLHFHFRRSIYQLISIFNKATSKFIKAVVQDSPEHKEAIAEGHICIEQNESIKGAILTRIAALKEDCLSSNTPYAEIFKSTPDEKPTVKPSTTKKELKVDEISVEDNIKKAMPVIEEVTSANEVLLTDPNEIIEIK